MTLLIATTVFPAVGMMNDNKNIIENQVVQDPLKSGASSWEDEWPKFQHDLNNTGYSTSSIAPQTNTVLWSYTTDDWVVSSPAVVNRKVYIGSMDEKFYCLDADTGQKLWDYPIPGATSSCSSAAVADGKVYVATSYYCIYCWDADTGDEIWNYTTGYDVISSPAVADGKVYICSSDSYSGSGNNYLYCLDATNGEIIWSDLGNSWMSSPPTIVDGKVYSSGGGGCCLDAETGELLWTGTLPYYAFGSSAVAYNRVYTYTVKYMVYGYVYCLDAENGEEIWKYPTNNRRYPLTSPAVADGKVYVSICETGMLVCLDAETGEKLWNHYVCEEYLESSPAVAYGRVYVGGGSSSKIYCFEVHMRLERKLYRGCIIGIFNRLKKFFKKAFKMDENNNDLIKKGLIIGGLIGLGYLLYKLLSNPRKDTMIYRCGNCDAILKSKQRTCYRCGYRIIWS